MLQYPLTRAEVMSRTTVEVVHEDDSETHVVDSRTGELFRLTTDDVFVAAEGDDGDIDWVKVTRPVSLVERCVYAAARAAAMFKGG